jgi:hypothetical protein
MNDAKYRLKKGFIIDLTYSGGGYVTADNVSDDIARELIRTNKAYIDFFEAYPKDEVKEMIEGNEEIVSGEDVKTDEKVSEDAPSGKVVPTHDELAVKTKAELVEILGDNPRVNKEELIKRIIEKFQA